MFPTTGSSITPAILSPFAAKSSFSAAVSLYFSTTVSCVAPTGTPGLFGTPRVRALDPADTSSASTWPW